MLGLRRRPAQSPARPLRTPRPPEYDRFLVDLVDLGEIAERADRLRTQHGNEVATLLREYLAAADHLPGAKAPMSHRAALAMARGVPHRPARGGNR